MPAAQPSGSVLRVRKDVAISSWVVTGVVVAAFGAFVAMVTRRQWRWTGLVRTSSGDERPSDRAPTTPETRDLRLVRGLEPASCAANGARVAFRAASPRSTSPLEVDDVQLVMAHGLVRLSSARLS